MPSDREWATILRCFRIGAEAAQGSDCSGRTQRRLPGSPEAAPQRMDFGQGKSRMMAGRISASTSCVGRPGRSIRAT
jgi:hypothetical protein